MCDRNLERVISVELFFCRPDRLVGWLGLAFSVLRIVFPHTGSLLVPVKKRMAGDFLSLCEVFPVEDRLNQREAAFVNYGFSGFIDCDLVGSPYSSFLRRQASLFCC